MESVRPWPPLADEDRWAIELMEERLRDPWQTPARLRERAQELRVEAGETDIKGIRDAVLTLADHYEEAARARTASRT